MLIKDETQWPRLAVELLKRFPNGAVVGLSGGLGAGKTTFVRSFIGHLCELSGEQTPRVLSPSFVFRQPYPELTPPVDHFDLYRLENIGEPTLHELGVFEAVELAKEKKGFVFIEWPEKILPGLFKFDALVTWQAGDIGRTIQIT